MSKIRRLGDYNYISQVQTDTRFRLAEFIVEQTGVEIEAIDIKDTDTIPEHSGWLLWHGNKKNIIPNLSMELDKNEDTIRRRLTDYEQDGQIEIYRENSSYIEGNVVPVNVRLLKPGIGYYLETVTEMRIRERLLSEEAVEKLESLVAECALMAANLGDSGTAEAFDQRYEYKSPFEFNRDEFRKEITYIRKIHKNLISKTRKTNGIERV